jgi:hypothetical protein
MLLTAPIWTAYEVYTAIYPTDSFYLAEFKKVTLREAPESAKVIMKDATYPDFHGEYHSEALIRVSKNDYSLLLNELTKDHRITQNKPRENIGSNETDKVTGSFKTEQVIYSFSRHITGPKDNYLYIGFLDDKQTLVITVWVL